MAKCAGAVLFYDGKLVMQRRDSQTPNSPNMLSLFGGHCEAHESPHMTLIRELNEETSLPVSQLKFNYVAQFPLHGHDKAYIYKAQIGSDHFKVFEGRGAEVYPLKELLSRSDLDPDTRCILKIMKADNNDSINN